MHLDGYTRASMRLLKIMLTQVEYVAYHDLLDLERNTDRIVAGTYTSICKPLLRTLVLAGVPLTSLSANFDSLQYTFLPSLWLQSNVHNH